MQPAAPSPVAPAGRLRVPRYPVAWWLLVVTEIISVAGWVLALATDQSSWFLVTEVLTAGSAFVFATWAVSTAIRLREYGWAWGIGIGSYFLVLLGPLAPIPALVFTLVGPAPLGEKLMATHPRFRWLAIAVTLCTLLGLVTTLAGVNIYAAASTLDEATGHYVATDPATYSMGLTIFGIGLIAFMLALFVGMVMTVWTIVTSLRLRRWGWAIAALFVGFLPFAFNGPTSRRYPAA